MPSRVTWATISTSAPWSDGSGSSGAVVESCSPNAPRPTIASMASDRTSGKSAREPHDRFDVKGLREQIGEVDVLDLIATIEEHAQVAGEGGGVAGDVGDVTGFGGR